MQTIDAIEKRRSVRKFKSKKITFDKILEIIDAGIKAPTAGNIAILKCLIISDATMKQSLAESADQDFMNDASWILVICSDHEHLEKTYDDRAPMYAYQEAGAAIQNMLLRATDLGIGSCWIGSFLDSKVRRVVDIPENITIEAMIALGVPDEKPKEKRKVLEHALFWEKWGQTKKPSYF